MRPPSSSACGRRPRPVAVLATVLVVAATALGGAVGSAEARAAFPPERTTRVLVLGDSVVKGTAAHLPGALPDREVVLDAEVSRSTGATADAAAGHGTDWDVVVILAGFNDGGSPGAYQPGFRRMLDQFAAVPRVVLLTLHEVRPYYATVNAFLRDQAAQRANVRVGDWNAVVAANPGCLAGDGLHPNGTGQQLLAGLIGEQVGQAEFDHELAYLAAAKQRADATSTTTATTTAPPTTTTTTTVAPTTTTAEVGLAPPVSIDRAPTSTTEAAPVAGAEDDEPDDDDSSLPRGLAVALPVGLLLGAGSIVLTRRRRDVGPAATTDPDPGAR